MFRLLRFAQRKRKQQRKYIIAMVTALPQLWRHALRSASNSALVTVRSSPTPNVHRGERRYHVKKQAYGMALLSLRVYTVREFLNIMKYGLNVMPHWMPPPTSLISYNLL